MPPSEVGKGADNVEATVADHKVAVRLEIQARGKDARDRQYGGSSGRWIFKIVNNVVHPQRWQMEPHPQRCGRNYTRRGAVVETTPGEVQL